MIRPLLILAASVAVDSWSMPPQQCRVYDRPQNFPWKLYMSSTTDSLNEATAPPLMDDDPASPASPASVSIPEDDFFTSRNPYRRFVKPILTSFHTTEKRGSIHDEALRTSGGVWRSIYFKPVYGITVHDPKVVRQLNKAEARNELQNDWPDSFLDVLGRDSLSAVQDISKDSPEGQYYFKAKKVLVDALSTQNVLRRSLSGIYSELDRLEQHWDEVASSEAVTTLFAEDISSLSYNVIINAIFGSESMTDEEMVSIRGHTTNIAKGVLSFPIDVPILNKVPFFRRYHRAMEARKAMKTLVESKIAEKREQMARCKRDGVEYESKGILDDFILQMETDDSLSEEKVIRFCVDNTIISIFAGFDTTASTVTTIMMLLNDDKEARDLVRKELESFDVTSIPKGQLEAMDSLPILKSAMMEAVRMRHPGAHFYRKTTAPMTVGNVVIPANSTVQLNTVYGAMSKVMYGDEPEKACPLRFYKSGFDKNSPQPLVFGFGKHLCPGQYLAQIEIALLTKAFLCRYDYELIEGQNLEVQLPIALPKSGLEMRLTRRIPAH